VRSFIYIVLCFLPFGLYGQNSSGWTAKSPTIDVEVSISIYPNPTIDFVTIKSEAQIEEGKYVLTNMIGKQLATGVFSGQATILLMDKYSKGIYMLSIFDVEGKRLTTRKILKE